MDSVYGSHKHVECLKTAYNIREKSHRIFSVPRKSKAFDRFRDTHIVWHCFGFDFTILYEVKATIYACERSSINAGIT